MEGDDFMEYLELQGNLDMVTKSELLDIVRKQGVRISDRQLITYVSEGLVPKSARIGSRSGAYPRIVADLIRWIDSCRRRRLSVEAIKELLPLWRFLRRSRVKKELDLSEFEYVARQFVTLQEAAYAAPFLLMEGIPCHIHDTDELASFRITTRGGRVVDTSTEKTLSISFRLGEVDDETGKPRGVARTCLALPLVGAALDDEDTITLGIPNGIDWPPDAELDLNEEVRQESS